VKLYSKDNIKVGVVVWFTPTGVMTPPLAQLDQYAVKRMHPYVCTFYDQISGASQWLFLTSDPSRSSNGCVFGKGDKEGAMTEWFEKDSYFVSNNCVEIAKAEEVVKRSQDDSFAQPASVKKEVLDKFGVNVLKKKENQ
jgi:hypothetical protein